MDYGTAGTALASGLLFGFVLEQAGFGSPCKLTAQFRFTDWSVFKVMFTAILVASLGIQLLQLNNTFGSTGFYVSPAMLAATALGGAFVGAGFAVGGYCPGTSVVGAMTGRMDGVVFAVGMVLGIWVFSLFFDAQWMQDILQAGKLTEKTLPQLLGISPWTVLSALTVLAIVGFVMGSRFEKRFSHLNQTDTVG
jgi:uncharacterized protein